MRGSVGIQAEIKLVYGGDAIQGGSSVRNKTEL